MSEHSILMSAPMVRAILEGRKTQTRRLVKLNVAGRVQRGGRQWHVEDGSAVIACPYGKAGDMLWVRETFGEFKQRPGVPVYRADDALALGASNRWRPSIHMPRKYSRITLEVTDVRVERLQDISVADAMAEGVFPTIIPVTAYRVLWESINGKGSWAANPWVWAVSFEVANSTEGGVINEIAAINQEAWAGLGVKPCA